MTRWGWWMYGFTGLRCTQPYCIFEAAAPQIRKPCWQDESFRIINWLDYCGLYQWTITSSKKWWEALSTACSSVISRWLVFSCLLLALISFSSSSSFISDSWRDARSLVYLSQLGNNSRARNFWKNFGREHANTWSRWVQDGLWSDQSCPLPTLTHRLEPNGRSRFVIST